MYIVLDSMFQIMDHMVNVWSNVSVISGYTYALGPNVAVTTSTILLTAAAPEDLTISTWAPTPTCSIPTWSCNSGCNSKTCEVQGGTVELLFWPTAIASSGQYPNTSITGAGPATTVYKGMTLTSPSVYIEFKTAYALDGCSQAVGGTYPGAIIAVNPDELYSINAELDYLVSTVTISDDPGVTTFYQSRTVDYNDLIGLPPGEAYNDMPICVPVGCGIITPSLFHPQLVVPTQVRNLDPAWASCGLDWRGSWDPPIALQPGGMVEAVTTETPATYIATAMPESTGEQPAKETGAMISDSSSMASGPASLVVSFPSATHSTSAAMPTYSKVSDPSATAPAESLQASGHFQPTQASDATHSHASPMTLVAESTTSTTVGATTQSTYGALTAIIQTYGGLSSTGTSTVTGINDTTKADGSAVSISAISSSTFSPSNAYDVLTAALPPTTTAFIAIVTDSSGVLHTIAQEPEGYVFDSTMTVSPGHAATISGLGLVSAGSDGEVYGLASAQITTARSTDGDERGYCE
ncbi:hypothetical protein B0A48_04306 [Cryoendolithus antarcticus]|uniref:Uncharacterized protein n=1 Tax=Cryoendolithus antarcticus TaxID=1507870 RepID=A0A1V8TFD2_9PEZI|nr:hypothetical protein B0A48_04306 [Cryoendolithus antarcticus]